MPKIRSSTRTWPAALAVLLTTMIVGAPAASAAYPESVIEADDIKYGASYMTGKVFWYDRSILVRGPAHFVGCRTLYVEVYDILADGVTWKILDHKSTSPKCDGDFLLERNASADAPGGADVVVLNLADGEGRPLLNAYEYYFRSDTR